MLVQTLQLPIAPALLFLCSELALIIADVGSVDYIKFN